MKQLPKRPRLPNFDYLGTFAYSITINTDYRKKYFSDYHNVELVFSVLEQSSRKLQFQVCIYCFMPDHLHLLLKGETHKADLKKFVRIFKQRSGYVFKQENKCKLWQPSFHDHVLREEEDQLEVARYILLNPVRKGLVDNYKDYPFSGSQVWNIDKL